MPRVDLTLETDIEQTAKVAQVEGIFDLPASEKTKVEYHFDVPIEDRPWNIGLIVGPSGAGKSSVARAIFGGDMASYQWPENMAIVDGFGSMPIRDVTTALSSVGFSSPPNWLRPFRVLSNGEQFRANMARVLVDDRPMLCVDEFTSVVDRAVAQIGSHAIGNAIRARSKKLVAVTCHYDVEEWLQPDWVLQPHLGQFAWRLLRRRPSVDVKIVRATRDCWHRFAPYHYMSNEELTVSCRVFVATINDDPVAMLAVMPFSKRGYWRLYRGVTMPDYQGLGLMSWMTDWVGRTCATLGITLTCTMSHPATIHIHAKSPRWEMIERPTIRPLKKGKADYQKVQDKLAIRRTASFRYVGPRLGDHEHEQSLRIWHGRA